VKYVRHKVNAVTGQSSGALADTPSPSANAKPNAENILPLPTPPNDARE
jgi:hypothetical protein